MRTMRLIFSFTLLARFHFSNVMSFAPTFRFHDVSSSRGAPLPGSKRPPFSTRFGMMLLHEEDIASIQDFFVSNVALGSDESVSIQPGSQLIDKPNPALSLFDPDMEAEVLSDLAHVAMDFSTFFSASRSLLRLYSIIGRLFVLSADYLPDHSIQPDELLIQLFLLFVAIKDITRPFVHKLLRKIRR